MWSETVCPSCGSFNLEPGTLGPDDRLYFRSEHTRFLRLGAADIDVTATLCLDCGRLALTAETSEVKALAHAIAQFARRGLTPN